LCRQGRKPASESRAAEIRLRLAIWKQTPESLRSSLRALARNLGTSHQLLSYYLDGLDEWQCREHHRRAMETANRKAEEIRARAKAESREMSMRECVDVIIMPGLLAQIEGIRRDAQRGPLHSAQLKIVKIFAKQGVPGAQEALEQCSRVGLKERKRFRDIVKETPRLEGETDRAWTQRIFDECDKYETNIPRVIALELLEKWSRSGLNAVEIICH
jgi:hypothetical protein